MTLGGADRGARSYDEGMDGEVSGAEGSSPEGLMVGRRSPALTEELWRLVSQAKRDDVLAPVTVVSPTRYASLSLRQELGRSGFANVHFIEIPVITEMLGSPRLAREGRTPDDGGPGECLSSRGHRPGGPAPGTGE